MEAAGNVTIFSPTNQAFEKLSTKVENIDVSILRRWALKHFIKGYHYKRDIKSGPVSIYLSKKSLISQEKDLLTGFPSSYQLISAGWQPWWADWQALVSW